MTRKAFLLLAFGVAAPGAFRTRVISIPRRHTMSLAMVEATTWVFVGTTLHHTEDLNLLNKRL